MVIDPDIEALARHLDEAAKLLRQHDEFHWADWLSRDANLIRGLDFYGIVHLRRAFGGMGSLNDLILTKRDSANPTCIITSPDDSRFQQLRDEIGAMSRKLADEER
jgi:hypothetical protein